MKDSTKPEKGNLIIVICTLNMLSSTKTITSSKNQMETLWDTWRKYLKYHQGLQMKSDNLLWALRTDSLIWTNKGLTNIFHEDSQRMNQKGWKIVSKLSEIFHRLHFEMLKEIDILTHSKFGDSKF